MYWGGRSLWPYYAGMSDSPRIHLGSLIRTSEDAHTSGTLMQLKYVQGEETNVLRFAEPAEYDVHINSLGGHEMYLQGYFHPTLIMECARCLIDVPVPLEIKLGSLVRYEPHVDIPYLEQAESGEEVLVFGDPDIDLSDFLAELTLLNGPLSVLHAPDCKGLCQECGHDLNKGPCKETCKHMAQVPIEEIEDELGTPESNLHAKQNPFAVLKDLKLPEDS